MNPIRETKRPASRRASSLAIGILSLVSTIGCSADGGDSLTGGEQPLPTTGTIRVDIRGGGPQMSGAVTVQVIGPAERSKPGAIGSTSTFVDLPPGTYTVAAISQARFIACQSVNANLVAGEIATADITCTRLIGTITGTVSSGGAPISGATIRLSGSSQRQVTTRQDGTFSIVVTVGETTLTTVHAGFICPDRTVTVEQDQTTTVDISCTAKTTGSITGKVVWSHDEGFGIEHATVTLTGPSTLTTTTSSSGHFAFQDLEPGSYSVAAASIGIGTDCPVVRADVQATRTTEVLVRCTFRDHPTGSEIEGAWGYHRQLVSQTGSCSAPLPESGTGSMRFDSNNNRISIVGLDPQVVIVGSYNKDSGFYRGVGKAVLADGSSVETDVSVTFFFFDDPWDFGSGTAFSTDLSNAEPSQVMVRRHRDPAGNLICTEIYQASGGR